MYFLCVGVFGGGGVGGDGWFCGGVCVVDYFVFGWYVVDCGCGFELCVVF